MTRCIYCGAKIIDPNPEDGRPCACMSCLKTRVRQVGVLKRVEYMPAIYEPGIFYYSERFGGFGHLCPCGCGNKIYIPVSEEGSGDNWKIIIRDEKVTLEPSLLNPCKAHYFIRDGEVIWV